MGQGIRVGLGTDGMTSNMLEEARASLFIRHHVTNDPRTGWGETATMLLDNNPGIASGFFGKKLGVLEAGAAADLVIADYWPFTPAKPENTLGHILYGVAAEGIHSTICAGKLLMYNRELKTLDMNEIATETLKRSPATWQRFASL
jgi:cytosine/adenosine deaminase-related metal-dependent hydrolase